MKRRRLALAVAALLTVPAGIVTASPADASVRVCNETEQQFTVRYDLRLPLWTDGASGSLNCYVGSKLPRFTSPIKALQSALNICYHTDLAVDGVYGARTASAVGAVQRIENITSDGVYGPVTGRTIYWPLRRISDHAFLYCWKQ